MIKTLLDLVSTVLKFFLPKPKDVRRTAPDVIDNRNAVENTAARREASRVVHEAVEAGNAEDPKRQQEALDALRRHASQ